MFILRDIAFIVLGFVLLIKGADFFVDGAVSVANRLGIPHIIVGLTIVAFGTSAPEAAVSISSALRGNVGISVGNVLGSNIMNILVILGITACIVPLHIQQNTIKYDIPFLIFTSILLGGVGFYFSRFSLYSGILFWALLIGYIGFLIVQALKTEVESEEEEKKLSAITIILFIIGGIAAIVFGSDIAVKGASSIAATIGVSDRIIGLTIVALGTSLPELMTSVTAARKGNADIAIGNIVGSNLFNILFILGTTSLIAPLPFGAEYYIDTILAIVAAVLLFLCVLRKKVLGRLSGVLFLIIYAAYLYFLIRG